MGATDAILRGSLGDLGAGAYRQPASVCGLELLSGAVGSLAGAIHGQLGVAAVWIVYAQLVGARLYAPARELVCSEPRIGILTSILAIAPSARCVKYRGSGWCIQRWVDLRSDSQGVKCQIKMKAG